MVGIGTDVVDVERMRSVLARTPSFVDRVFAQDEQEYATRAKDPVERYAARFAAKEAALKALGLGLGGMALRDIVVARAESGEPSLELRGDAGEVAIAHGVGRWLLTMSHSKLIAQATVVALASADDPTLRVELYANEIAATVEFYQDVLGAVVERREDGYAHLRLGQIELGIVAAADLPPDHPAHPGDGLHGAGLELVIEVPDVDAAWERVARRVEDTPAPEARSWGLRDFRFVDPDGVYLRVTDR